MWVGLKRGFSDGHTIYRNETLPADTSFDDFGVGQSKGSAAALHMHRMHHPLKGDISMAQLEEYAFPSFDPAIIDTLKLEADRLHAKGLAFVGSMTCTLWETSWYLRSMEDLMTDMMMEDEKAVFLFDRVAELACKRAAAAAQAGADIIFLGDDIGTQRGAMLSVDMWETWIKHRFKKIIDAARAVNPSILIWYHSCGNVMDFLEGFVDAGVDILNPIQQECMDFNEVYDRVGDRLAFWGTIGTQQVLPFGKPEDVRRDVLSRLEKCGKKGGIVMGPTHLVEPEVPWENLLALRDAAAEFKG